MSNRLVMFSLISLAIAVNQANAGCCDAGCESGCLSCPSCNVSCCELKSEAIEVEKSCWKVECKKICVPRVVFPWQKPCRTSCDGCCDSGCASCDACNCNNGACVKTVKVLKKHKYKCPSCKYTWTPVETCATGCDTGCCDTGCASGSGGVIIESDSHEQPEPAAEPADDVPPAPPASASKKSNRAKAKMVSLRVSRSLKMLISPKK